MLQLFLDLIHHVEITARTAHDAITGSQLIWTVDINIFCSISLTTIVSDIFTIMMWYKLNSVPESGQMMFSEVIYGIITISQ